MRAQNAAPHSLLLGIYNEEAYMISFFAVAEVVIEGPRADVFEYHGPKM